MTGGFRVGQVISGGLLALAHGTNDAQKTMGVIALALVANGTISASDFHAADLGRGLRAAAIALGTYAGGWRIIKTMGSRIHKMDSAQGFAAQGAGAAVILAASPRRLPALHDAHDLGRRDRLGRGQAAVGGALGVAGQHRRRLDRDAAGGGGDRRAHLRRHAPVRHRRGRAGDRGLGADPRRVGLLFVRAPSRTSVGRAGGGPG